MGHYNLEWGDSLDNFILQIIRGKKNREKEPWQIIVFLCGNTTRVFFEEFIGFNSRPFCLKILSADCKYMSLSQAKVLALRARAAQDGLIYLRSADSILNKC